MGTGSPTAQRSAAWAAPLLGALIGGLATGRWKALWPVPWPVVRRSRGREHLRQVPAAGERPRTAGQLCRPTGRTAQAWIAPLLPPSFGPLHDERSVQEGAAEYKAGAIAAGFPRPLHGDPQRSQKTSRILSSSDHVISERDAGYQKTLAQAQAKGQVSQCQQAPRKEKKAWNNSRRELESTRQDVDMRLATYEQTVNNLML